MLSLQDFQESQDSRAGHIETTFSFKLSKRAYGSL